MRVTVINLVLAITGVLLTGCMNEVSNNFSDAFNSYNIEKELAPIENEQDRKSEAVVDKNTSKMINGVDTLEEAPHRVMDEVLKSFNDWNTGQWIQYEGYGANANIADIVWAYLDPEKIYSDQPLHQVEKDLNNLKDTLEIYREKYSEDMEYKYVKELFSLADEAYETAEDAIQSRTPKDLEQFNEAWKEYSDYMTLLWEHYISNSQ